MVICADVNLRANDARNHRDSLKFNFYAGHFWEHFFVLPDLIGHLSVSAVASQHSLFL